MKLVVISQQIRETDMTAANDTNLEAISNNNNLTKTKSDEDSTEVVGMTPDDSTKDASDNPPPDGNKEREATITKMPVKMVIVISKIFSIKKEQF